MPIETVEAQKLRDRIALTEGDLRSKIESAADRWRDANSELEDLLSLEWTDLKEIRGALVLMQDKVETRLEESSNLTALINRNEFSDAETAHDLRRRLDDRTHEIVILTKLLLERERSADASENNVRWLADVHRALAACPSWWNFMPPRWRQRKRAARIKRKGLFDGQAYLKRYPDIAQQGMDPLYHCIVYGLAEGRRR